MGEEYYNYFPISETPDTVEGVTMAPFVVAESRNTQEDNSTNDPGSNDWGPYSENPEQPQNFWDSLVSAFDAGAGRALANIKKAITPAQAAAAGPGRPSAGSSGGGSPSSTKPNQTTTTTTNTTNNVLTSPVAILAMIFGGIYLLKIARK